MKDAYTEESELESYLYIITHDLKTYSRAMRTIPDWIAEDLQASGLDVPPEVAEHVVMLKRYAAGMDRMLEGLTELSRVGRLSDPTTPVNLRNALETAWQRVPNRTAFSMVLSDVDINVYAAPNDLDRLLFAVLSNAVHHHDKPTGRVHVSAKPFGDRILLSVADEGPGIPAHFHEKVFDPLHTLKAKDEVESAGCGLTVARKVVKHMGGSILLRDGDGGRGLVVECDLPSVPPGL